MKFPRGIYKWKAQKERGKEGEEEGEEQEQGQEREKNKDKTKGKKKEKKKEAVALMPLVGEEMESVIQTAELIFLGWEISILFFVFV